MPKRFHFRLETVLSVRRLRERQAQRKLAAQQAEIARLDQLDRQTLAEISRQQERLRAAQQSPHADPADWTRARAWIAHLRRTLGERQVARRQMLAAVEQLRAEWRAARVQVKIIEKLRERRWGDYVRDRDRREQAEHDELARRLQGFEREADAAPAALTRAEDPAS
ncbi:MAG: flagellar export protein FliJ [Phycisphaerae bacterium]